MNQLTVSVTFDPTRGYVASHPELRTPVTVLSLGGLRRAVESALRPRPVEVKLILDCTARQERDQRRRGGVAGDAWRR